MPAGLQFGIAFLARQIAVGVGKGQGWQCGYRAFNVVGGQRCLVFLLFVAQVGQQGKLTHRARAQAELGQRVANLAVQVAYASRGAGQTGSGEVCILCGHTACQLEGGAGGTAEVVTAAQIELVRLVVRRQGHGLAQHSAQAGAQGQQAAYRVVQAARDGAGQVAVVVAIEGAVVAQIEAQLFGAIGEAGFHLAVVGADGLGQHQAGPAGVGEGSAQATGSDHGRAVDANTGEPCAVLVFAFQIQVKLQCRVDGFGKTQAQTAALGLEFEVVCAASSRSDNLGCRGAGTKQAGVDGVGLKTHQFAVSRAEFPVARVFFDQAEFASLTQQVGALDLQPVAVFCVTQAVAETQIAEEVAVCTKTVVLAKLGVVGAGAALQSQAKADAGNRCGVIAFGVRLQGEEGSGERERQQAAVKAERRIRVDHDGSRYFSAASAGASGC